MCIICLCLGAGAVFAENDDGISGTPSGTGSVISSQNSVISDGSAISSTASVTSNSAASVSSVVSKTVSSKAATSKKNNVSKQQVSSKAVSSKKSTVVKKSSVTVKTNSYSAAESYEQPVASYEDTDSISDKWNGKKTELESSESTSSARKLSKHLTDPKKAMMKWIWLPVLIALGCIAFLVYYNMYYIKNGGIHSKKKGNGKKGKKDDGSFKDVHSSENSSDTKKDDDPFSADNFFNFDNDGE